MPYVTTDDGTQIFYTDLGEGRPVLFSHGWPLNSDAWQVELKVFADAGYRVIAHDRRGHGRSSQVFRGNDLDTYALDLATVVEHLDLQDLVVIGHSTGGGEVVRYAAQHGGGRVSKVITAGAIPPLMLKTDANPDGLPISVFDGLRSGLLADRSQFYLDLSVPFFGANREGSKVSQGAKEDFWRQGMLVNMSAAYDCIKAFSETDQTADLQALDVPILIAQGDDDQIVPIVASGEKAIKLVKKGTLKVYPGRPHGIFGDYQVELDRDMLAFIAE